MCKLHTQHNTPPEVQIKERPHTAHYFASLSVNAKLDFVSTSATAVLYMTALNRVFVFHRHLSVDDLLSVRLVTWSSLVHFRQIVSIKQLRSIISLIQNKSLPSCGTFVL